MYFARMTNDPALNIVNLKSENSKIYFLLDIGLFGRGWRFRRRQFFRLRPMRGRRRGHVTQWRHLLASVQVKLVATAGSRPAKYPDCFGWNLKQNLNRIWPFPGLFYVSWRGQNIEWHFVKNSTKLIPQNYIENDAWKITLSKKFLKT